MWYLALIDASSCLPQSQTGQKHVVFLTTSACYFRRYRYARIPFGATVMRDIFQGKIGEIFKGVPSDFGIEGAILAVGYDENGHHPNMTLR